MNSVQALTGNTVETNLDTDEDANQTQQSEKDLHNECHGIQMQILGLLSEGVSQHYLTDKDRLDYMGAISLEKLEEGGAVSWEQKKRWLEDNMRSYVPHFLSEARHMTDEFMGEISKAKKQKWISSSSAERWRDRLFQRSTNWAETKSFLIQFKKGYMENWKKLSEKRKTIEGKKKELKVTAKEVPELKLLEKSGFDELHFFEKMRIASEALVALNMYKETSEHKKKLYEQAKKMMNGAIKSRFIRQDRAMKWIEDLFSSKLPAEKIEQNINGKLTNYIGEWTKVK